MKTGITAGFEPAGGGYADYVRVMDFVLPGVVKIPRGNSFIEGAMQEPVNTVLKGVKKLGLLRGDTVLVAGQGPIGLMFTRLLALRGIKVVTSDLMEERLKVAKGLGAKWVLNAGRNDFAETVGKLTGGRGLDAAVVAVPVDTVVIQAQKLVRGAGQVLLFAHTRRGSKTELDLSTICVDEKGLMGSYSSDLTLQKEVSGLVFSRKLDVRQFITHQYALEETAAAVELAAHPTPNSLKIMVMHEKK
jgi:L-iditol 2-dehydrogenase